MRSAGSMLCCLFVAIYSACDKDEARETLQPSTPIILAQPASTSAEACAGVTFAVNASGARPLSYQWLENGAAVPGATSSTYILERVGPADGGKRFSVVVSNAAGSVTSGEAVLTVDEPAGQVVVVQSDRIFDLASDGTNIYFTDGSGVGAASVDCSGPIRRLYERTQSYENATAIALGLERVVWGDTVSGSIRSVATRGGLATTIVSSLGPAHMYTLAVGGEQVFWPHSAFGIQTTNIDGGSISTLVGGFVNAGDITVDDRYVYWLDLNARQVKRAPRGGGEVAVLASDQEYAGYITTDGESVYWTNVTGHGTQEPTAYVMKVSRDGGTPVVLATHPAEIQGIAVDASFVYWTASLRVEGAAANGTVSRVPLDGSAAPSTLASGLTLPSHPAVDPGYLYWRDPRGIVRLAK